MTVKDPALVLQYLDTLLRYGNFTKAAQQLYISQPYLTQMIRRKEDELGVTLINRHSTHLKLTEAGKIYYEYLENINQEEANFQQKLAQYNNNDQITLKIGVLSAMGSFILPLVIPEFMRACPHVQVLLEEGVPSTSEKRIQNGDIDFYVGQNPETASPNLKVVTAGHEPYFVLIPESSRFYDKRTLFLQPDSLDLKELLSEPLVLSKTGSAIRHQVDGLLQKNKIHPDIQLESENIETIAGLSAYGYGTTVIPQSVVSHLLAGKYNLYPLDDEDLTLKYFIAYPTTKKLSKPEQKLIEIFSTTYERTDQISK